MQGSVFDLYPDALRAKVFADDAVAVEGILAQHGCIINQLGNGGSLLHEAAQIGAASVCGLLLDRGASVSLPDKDGLTPLHRVVSQRKAIWCGAPIVELLIARGADMGANSRRYATPLIEAIKSGNAEAVAMLLAAGASLAKQGRSEAVPLHSAATGFADRSQQICELLLDAGADVSELDSSGWTALHCAAFFGRKEICELLAEHGADTKAIACSVKKQVTPFQMAVSQDHVELVKWFIKTLCEDPSQKTLSGRALVSTAKAGSSTRDMLLSLKAEGVITSTFDEGVANGAGVRSVRTTPSL
jgi:ankyrin repeat protein